jgi:tRNA threonylcarbamoyladenosine biosynthesis protein TsaB
LERNKIFFFGDGAEKCKKAITHSNAHFIDNILPSASTLGKIAFSRFLKKDFEDIGAFAPFYLKDFVAKKASSVLMK